MAGGSDGDPAATADASDDAPAGDPSGGDDAFETVDAGDPAAGPSEGSLLALLTKVPTSLVGLAALGVGVALGSLFPEQLFFIGDGVRSAFRAIGDAAPYIIFFTLTPAVGSMLRTGSAGRFAGAVMVAMVVSTLSAGLFGILVAIPVLGLPLGAPDASFLAIVQQIAGETLTLAVTAPPFIAIWYGALVAIGLYQMESRDVGRWFAEPTADVLHRVGVDGVELIGKFIKLAFPFILLAIGIFIPTSASGAVDDARAELGRQVTYQVWGSSSPVVWYLFAVVLVAVTGLVWVLAVAAVVCRVTGFPYKRFLEDYFLYIYPFSWATASSTASIPLNLEQADEGLGVRSEVRDFIIPLGATVNLDGTMMAAFLLLPVATYLLGFQMTVMQLFMVLIPLTIVSVGVPGIPGGLAVVAPPVVLAFLPQLPEGAFIAIFAAIGVGLTDQFRTGVNTVDNGLMCMLFEHWYDDHFTAGDVPAAAGAGAAAGAAVPPDAPDAEPEAEPDADAPAPE